MSESIAKHQIFEYDGENPFHIINIYKTTDDESLLNHWHTELEIVYSMQGYSRHYIDGECVRLEPGRMVVVNSESVHTIIPEKREYDKTRVSTVVLLISREYLERALPDIKNIYFMPSQKETSSQIKELMHKISEYQAQSDKSPYSYLYMNGLVQMLLYYMCQDGLMEKNMALPVNCQRNIERLRGVLSYVEKHYREQITLAEIAGKFYFSKEYFARFFKRNTGFTFMEYVAKYRVFKARQELLQSDNSILCIALNNGFSDSRRFINAFKDQYHITPLQYRKSQNTEQLQEVGQ